MIRAALLLGLLGACAQAPEPAVTIYGVNDGHEPVVRVYLRSLGTWETLAVEGKGGLRVTEAGARFSTTDPVLLRSTRGGIILEPLEGVFFLADHTYSGRLVWEGGYLVNEVALENYILGVLRGELPLKDVPVEAAAAQAIAARSYTLTTSRGTDRTMTSTTRRSSSATSGSSTRRTTATCGPACGPPRASTSTTGGVR